jgi:enoyl-CoA hydratase
VLASVDTDDPAGARAAVAAAADVLEGLGKDLRTAFEEESKLSSWIFQTEDAKEGPKAFAEKRAPNWQAK